MSTIVPNNGVPGAATGKTPPGWYPDPTGAPHQRWFDGANWTTQVAAYPAPRSARTDTGPGSAMHWLLPVGRSWQSVVAPYLGLFSLIIPFLGLVAVGLGAWALARAGQGEHGSGRAVIAICLGLLGLFITWTLFVR